MFIRAWREFSFSFGIYLSSQTFCTCCMFLEHLSWIGSFFTRAYTCLQHLFPLTLPCSDVYIEGGRALMYFFDVNVEGQRRESRTVNPNPGLLWTNVFCLCIVQILMYILILTTCWRTWHDMHNDNLREHLSSYLSAGFCTDFLLLSLLFLKSC